MTRVGLFAIVLGACGPSPAGPGADSGGAPDVSVGIDACVDCADAMPRPDAGPPPFFGKVYAHSAEQLFEIDPDTLDITLIGDFSFTGAGPATDVITDIALDQHSDMVGISYDQVYAIDKATAVCTWLAPLVGQFNGLSFIPAEEIDPTGAEILVGTALDGGIWQIEPTTGASVQIGDFGGAWMSSGDIVSVSGFGTVATVNTGEGENDTLVRVNLFAGGVATPIGNTGESGVFGLGFWRGKVFGFTNTFKFVLIDTTNGSSMLVQDTVPYWWGAGVTTEAPIIP